MDRKVIIRISGNAVDVSPDGKSILSQEIRQLLEPQLRYKHLKFLRGQQAIDYSGRRRPIQEEIRLLYDYDKYGRLVCGIGFLHRITRLLTDTGYDVETIDVSPTHPNPNRFRCDWDNVIRHFSFRARQDEALYKIAANDRGLIDAPTGFGKTFLYKAVGLLYPDARIIITTKRKDIVQAIRLDLSTTLPNIGQIGGGVHKPGRITVVTADSLHRLEADDVDILIGEEVHELAAESYVSELVRFKQSHMFGFTATVTGRLDNTDIRLESLFGPVIFRMTYPEAVDLELVVPIRVRWLDVNGSNPCAGMVDIRKKRWGIWRNETRNRIIAEAARSFGPEEQVLIMVTTLEHAVYLRQFLPEFTLCYAERDPENDFNDYIKNGLLPEDEQIMTSKRRQLLRTQFTNRSLKKVIATDVWSTGVSFNGLSVLLRADARSAGIMDTQIPGRVCRLDEVNSKAEGLVIDCLDQFDPGLRETARKRRRNYESKGWIQDLPRYGRADLV